MAVVIDGTTGISTPANTVLGNLSYTGTLTGNGGIVNLGSGQVYKDASGNVGIGTSSPAKTLHVSSSSFDYVARVQSVGRTTTGIELVNSGSGANPPAIGSKSDAIFFETNNAERARIDSSGNLLVGTTTVGAANSNSLALRTSSGGGTIFINHINGTANGIGYAGFAYNGSSIGSILQSGTTAVSYNTTSDYRLKENIAPMTGALARVAALKPCTYTWKSAPDETGEGFIAHELAEVCPQAATGEKDAVDAEGKPQYQGIDTSFLVATLTAAIQEQQTLITALTARITALEGAAA